MFVFILGTKLCDGWETQEEEEKPMHFPPFHW